MMKCVSGSLCPSMRCNWASGGGKMKVKLMERLGGTMSPPTVVRILRKSSGGRGEASVHFKVVCWSSGVRWWMWRGPHMSELSWRSRIRRGVWCVRCSSGTSTRGPSWCWPLRCGAVGSSSDFCQRKVVVGKSTIGCARLEDDSGMVEES